VRECVVDPLVALTRIQYGPGEALEVMLMFRLVEPEPCEDRVTLAGVRKIWGPGGEIVALNLMVAGEAALSETVIVNECSVPGWTFRVDSFAFSSKSGWVGE